MSASRKLNRRERRQLEKLTGKEEHVRVKVEGSNLEPFGISKAGYNAIYNAGFEDGMMEERKKHVPRYARHFTYQILAVCCKILMENYAEIHVRKSRLRNFLELYARGLETLDEAGSTEDYVKYIEHFGIKTEWRESLENENADNT